MNRDIIADRNWTESKTHLKSIDAIVDKISNGIRLTDADLVMTKYGLLLVSCELKKRRCDDVEEAARFQNFGVDTPPAL